MRFLLALLFAAATSAMAQDRPTSSEVGLEAITYRGSGCRQGTVAQTISPDTQAFTLLFSDYLVDTSPRDGRPARRACDIDVTMRVPAGWSFTVYGLQVRGYASLEDGAIGVQKAASSFGAMPAQEIGRIRLEGPYNDDYQLSSNLPLDALEWSRCGGHERTRRFNLKTAITVRPRRGFSDVQGDVDDPALGRSFPRGLLTVDAIDGALAHEYRIGWRRCDDDTGPDVATCSITVGQGANQRAFSETKRGHSQQRAKQKATDKVVQTCQAALHNRPGQREQCRPERAVCSFSR